MSQRAGFRILATAIKRILEARSARGVSFSLSMLGMVSKPLGYLRTLLIAWLFGTSREMDAFYLASSIVAFVAGSLGSATESVVVPELARLKKAHGREYCESVFAASLRFLLLCAFVFALISIIKPASLIRFFASGFDEERVTMASRMLWWLLPFAVIVIVQPAIVAWAMFTERYTLSSVTAMPFNFVAIPVLLISAHVMGAYSVAMMMSLATSVTFILFLFFLKEVPTKVTKSDIHASSMRRIGRYSFHALALTGTSGLFVIVDKYFASLLPVGSVTALSYGSQMINIISMAALTPLVFFLRQASGIVVESPERARSFVKQASAIAISYFLPVGLFMAAISHSLVSLLLGWGRFGAESIVMTATCFSAYSIGMIFAITSSVIIRYAQATQRMGVMVSVNFTFVLINALLDWFLVTRWGLLGLACATSITQTLAFFCNYRVLMGESAWRFLLEVRLPRQALIVLPAAALVAWMLRYGALPQLLAVSVIGPACLFACERAGLLAALPSNWHPSSLVHFLFSSVRSIFRG